MNYFIKFFFAHFWKKNYNKKKKSDRPTISLTIKGQVNNFLFLALVGCKVIPYELNDLLIIFVVYLKGGCAHFSMCILHFQLIELDLWNVFCEVSPWGNFLFTLQRQNKVCNPGDEAMM